MRLNRILALSATALATVLVAQMVLWPPKRSDTQRFAMWRNSPNSIAEAKHLSNQIVKGRVAAVRRADDLVTSAPGEPNDQDRIPVEVVTIQVEKTFKGGQAQTIEVFHTGIGECPADRPEPPGPPPAQPAGGGTPKSARPARPSEEACRTEMLAEDPPYHEGDRVVLLLTDGPDLNVAGTTVKTKSVISPEGRYHVASGDKLTPVTRRKFAGRLRGRALRELETELAKP